MALQLNDWIDFVKVQAKTVFTGNRLNEIHYRFLTQFISPYKDYEVEITNLESFSWIGDDIIKEFPEEYHSHNFQSNFIAVCKLRFKSRIDGNNTEIEHEFKLTCDGWISMTGNSINFNFMDDQSFLLRKYDEQIKQNITKSGMPTLWEDRLKFRGKNGVSIFTEVVNKRVTTLNIPINAFERFDDLARCSSDIRYIIGEMVTFRPYTTNYLEDKMDWNGRVIYRHFPSFYDKQYWLKAGLLFQLFYNYWDKIGDIIALYFAPQLPQKQVFFGKVIDAIPNQILNTTYDPTIIAANAKVFLDNVFTSPHFQWLKNFKDNDFLKLNDKRIKMVHYNNIESEYFQEYVKHNTNEAELSRLQKEKEGLVDLFINEYNSCLKGFEETLSLIDLLP